jgi:hypothetical protein
MEPMRKNLSWDAHAISHYHSKSGDSHELLITGIRLRNRIGGQKMPIAGAPGSGSIAMGIALGRGIER